MSSPSFSIELPLAQWCEWDAAKAAQSEPPQTLPTLDFVDAMQRRRLSTLAKVSLWVAHQCVQRCTQLRDQNQSQVRMVYASRHGELAKTTDMLHSLAEAEALSPTAFSMSVLNASVGLYSIIQGNTAPATAVSAGRDTFASALLEVHGQLLAHPDEAVLLIYADEPLPKPYEEHASEPEAAHALALLFKQGGATRVSMRAAAELPQPGTQPQCFVRGLQSGQQVTAAGELQGWTWSFA